jgi:hypothetical protein
MDDKPKKKAKITPEERKARRLEEIKKNRKCKRLSADATKEEIRTAHLVKMQMKKIMRERMYQQFQGPAHIPANLSVNHPDHEFSMEMHLEQKAVRSEEDKRQHVL